MSEIFVTFEALSQAQADVSSTSSSINAQLEDLKQFLAPLVASWTGQAASEYQAKQNQWNQAANDLNLVLAQIGQALGAANETYQQTEAKNAASWG